MKVRYKGPDRHGYRPGRIATRDNRIPVPSGAVCTLVRRAYAGNLLSTQIDGKTVHFMAPAWQLRKLVKNRASRS